MAILYVDFISGNDTTGNGTAALPYLTVNKAVSIAGGPHDIRIAKTTAYTNVPCAGAGIGWTANSVTVTTSSNLTASIAIGDYIGKTTAAGNGAEETFYRVNAITATTITLEQKYGGTTATESSCNKIVIITTGAVSAHAMTLATGTTLSGGWNLTGTPAQDGETWFKGNTARTNATYYNVNAGSANGCNISKLNVIESYLGIYAGGNNNVSLCTSACYGYGIYTGSTGNITECNMSAVAASSLNGGNIINNCVFLGLVAGTTSTSAGSTITNCKFISGNVGINLATALPLQVYNNTFKYLTIGIRHNISNVVIDTCTFDTVGTGINIDGQTNGMFIKSCSFTTCTVGIALVLSHGLDIIECTFDSCGTGITLDGYTGDVFINNCTVLTPTTLFISRATNAGLVKCVGCTIDGASVAKAYNVTASGFATRQYILVNSFGQNGTIFGRGNVFQDSTVFRTTAPSTAISWSATTTNSPLDIKMVSAYVNSGVTRTFSFYLKASNASWSGSIVVKWKLGGILIKTESTPITSLTTSWVQYSYTCDSSLITSDGELSLEFTPNMNAYSVYLDDITIT